jgi:predicted ATPase
MTRSFLALKRVRVTAGASVEYDQEFHHGVNVIRGENSSGKSTIADFIFFGLERFSVDVNRNSKGVPKSAQIRFGLL